MTAREKGQGFISDVGTAVMQTCPRHPVALAWPAKLAAAAE